MKNKLVLLLVATLGLTQGLIKANSDRHPQGSNPLDPTYVFPEVKRTKNGIKINGVEISIAELQRFFHAVNETRRRYTTGFFTEVTIDRFIDDLAQYPDPFKALKEYASRLSPPIIIPEVSELRESAESALAKRLGTRPLKRASNAITGVARDYVDGYRLSNWNATGISKTRKAARLSSRAVRDLIHAANAANLLAEIVGDRNMILDGLNVNKTLAKNKNFMWLRKGKSKSARALRVIFSSAQAILLGALNQLALGKLVKMADAKPLKEGQGTAVKEDDISGSDSEEGDGSGSDAESSSEEGDGSRFFAPHDDETLRILNFIKALKR